MREESIQKQRNKKAKSQQTAESRHHYLLITFTMKITSEWLLSVILCRLMTYGDAFSSGVYSRITYARDFKLKMGPIDEIFNSKLKLLKNIAPALGYYAVMLARENFTSNAYISAQFIL